MRFRLLALGLVAACHPAVSAPPAPPVATAPAPAVPAPAVVETAPAPLPEVAAPEPAPAPTFVERDINHVLSTGQSLAVGVAGAPPTTLAQPFGNLMFNTGVMAGNEDLELFVPLVEGDNIPGSKVHVETMSASFANLVAELAPGHVILLSNHASGAKTYAQLKKGTKYYANGLIQVARARDIAKDMGKSYVVRAITTVHGESDHAEKSTHYAADMLEWQADYERDVRALTGQSEPVPMFETQISSWTKMMGGTATSLIPGAQLEAHLESHGKVVLVGPKYHLPYAKDGVHLTMEGYRQMGEDYAKAYKRVVIDGQPWEPLRPVLVTRDGAVITVRFVVPAPPIVLDTALVTNPGNFGFEYAGAAGASSPKIAKVDVTGPDTVTITLTSAPAATGGHLRYAFTGKKGARAGPTSGPRGNLRDSDATKSRSGKHLYNWCIHFDESVP